MAEGRNPLVLVDHVREGGLDLAGCYEKNIGLRMLSLQHRSIFR